MNIRFLETFVWVARLRSFRKAAKRVHATQAAVSQRITVLEADLGVRLLDRDRREVHLTREGHLVYERAETIVQLYGETRRRLGGGIALKPDIRLGVTDTVSLTFLPDLYRRLIRDYDAESVDARVDLPITHYQALRNGEIDAAIGPVISQAPELMQVGLCSLEMVWVASPQLKVPKRKLTLAELVQFPIISYARTALPHRLIVDQLQRAGIRGVKLHSVSSLAGVLMSVKGGAGVSAVPRALIQEVAHGNPLQVIRVDESLPDVQLSLSYLHAPDESTPRLLVSLVRESVKAYFARVPAGSMTLL